MPAPSNRERLSLAQQYLLLKNNPQTAGSGALTKTKLSWVYETRPSPLARCYRVRIELERRGTPDVYVEDPNIEILAAGRRIPHVYHDPLRLCLYFPSSGQWSPAKRLDRTIAAWATLWLYYFEDWLAFDDWKGEGLHPDETEDPRLSRRLRRSLR